MAMIGHVEGNLRRSQRILKPKNYKIEWPKFTWKRKRPGFSTDSFEETASERLPLNSIDWRCNGKKRSRLHQPILSGLYGNNEDVAVMPLTDENFKSGSKKNVSCKKKRRGRPLKQQEVKSAMNSQSLGRSRKTRSKTLSEVYPAFNPPLIATASQTKPITVEQYYHNTCSGLTASVNTMKPPTSILPIAYPLHFVNQRSLDNNPTLEAVLVEATTANSEVEELFPTPEATRSYDWNESSSPSLTESLRGIFRTDDIREILNIEKIVYRLCQHHVKALACVLNVNVVGLSKVLDEICKLDESVVERALNFENNKPVATEQSSMVMRRSSTISVSSFDTVSEIEVSPTGENLQRRYFPSQLRSQ